MYYKRLDQVLSTRINDDMVLLDAEGGYYHHMNPTGSAIWEALERPLEISQLVSALRTQYRIRNANIDSEVEAFLQELLGMGLIAAGDTPEL
jgi:hypothetical protein